ncbi:MAG: helix-turn-helix domain-containing protein [Christensenellaceae bacterium]|jgi:transcriptional regulator with XRE-family HTH domain|nr:helix-turn-helix domain-containing protein [Christensenellaceae bacterium]
MKFSEKLLNLRHGYGKTQTDIANALGVTLRTYQNYEKCGLFPRNPNIYKKLSQYFHVTVDYLIADGKEDIETPAAVKTITRSNRHEIVSEVGALFAGGDLSDLDKDKIMKVISDLYWKAKLSKKRVTQSVHNDCIDFED